MDATEKLVARGEIAAWVRIHRKARAPIVLTNGVFDLLHLGHVRYLQEARALGAALLVGLNSDASTQRLKGPRRPLVPEQERAEVLAGLACVDAVTIFDEDTATELVEEVRPEIYVKGGDYAAPDQRGVRHRIYADELRRLAASAPDSPTRPLLPRASAAPHRNRTLPSPAATPRDRGAWSPPSDLFTRLPEARAVAHYGGSICLIPYLPGHSTSDLIERIARRYGV
ncbi:MAG: hypothetical protein PVSMB4_14220 [Ktedonobacterales bacterium]